MVVLYEGLFGTLPYPFGSRLKVMFEESFPGTKYIWKSYSDKTPLEGSGHILIGHSFGGKTAMEVAAKQTRQVDHVLTLDARGWDFWNNKKRVSPFSPKMAPLKHTNLYQTTPLRGYEVKHAENFNMGSYGHMSLAAHKEVISAIKNLLS